MNPWQMAQQIKYKLETAVWPTGAGDLVFGRGASTNAEPRAAGSVVVFAGTPTEEQIPAGFPWCMVGIGSGTPDESDRDSIFQTFNLITAAEVAGDPHGEFAVIGGAVSNLGKSVGRGIAEIATRVRATVEELTTADGASIILESTGIDAVATIGGGRHLAMDELQLTALCTSDLFYAAPQKLVHSGGTWTWDGGQCSNRFDFYQYNLVRKSGTTASTSPSDGTSVYSGTTASFTGAATSDNVYTCFAEYNARHGTGASAADGNSDPIVGSYVVVA